MFSGHSGQCLFRFVYIQDRFSAFYIYVYVYICMYFSILQSSCYVLGSSSLRDSLSVKELQNGADRGYGCGVQCSSWCFQFGPER